MRPTRGSNGESRAIATAWPCTRWGLPCRPAHTGRGALLPHLFTLTANGGGFFSVALSRSRPAAAENPDAPGQDGGRYPPPWLCGARTFLPRSQERERPSTHPVQSHYTAFTRILCAKVRAAGVRCAAGQLAVAPSLTCLPWTDTMREPARKRPETPPRLSERAGVFYANGMDLPRGVLRKGSKT